MNTVFKIYSTLNKNKILYSGVAFLTYPQLSPEISNAKLLPNFIPFQNLLY